MIRRIVARVDLDEFTERVLDSFWERPEYQRFRPLREDVRAWVRWNIDLVIRWLVDGQPPSESDLERFRERARTLAANGMPADIVPANFRRGARYAWTALLDAAREDERAALRRERRPAVRVHRPRLGAVLGHLRVGRAAADDLRGGAPRPGAARARRAPARSRAARTSSSPSASASS